VAKLLDLRAQVEGMERRARDRAELSEVAKRANELARKLQDVLDRLYESRFIGVDDQLLLFPLKLNARLASLGGVVASADRATTAAAHEVFGRLSSELDSELARLRELLSSDLPELNRLAQDRGMTLVSRVLGFAPAASGGEH
jgi:hypothetical protein